MPLSDLTVDAFLILRESFFDEDGLPKPFMLREKRNTQDDPLDEYIADILSTNLTDIRCQKSSGPLISPDLVLYRSDECTHVPPESLSNDLSRIVAIEVKKLERSASGQIARSTGLDYNTTPPCGTVRVYDADDQPLDIRGFYLFVCQERTRNGGFILSALALCDGNILNEDFALYLRVTSQREKEVGLGTYGNGADRNRPMLIFANPLGAPQLDHASTLVSAANKVGADARVGLVYRFSRGTAIGEVRSFFAYRKARDIPSGWEIRDLADLYCPTRSETKGGGN